ncbi:efflux RND transporter permease subunit [Caulobacter segnis]
MTAWLYIAVPKSCFPQQDSGRLMAGIRADQSVSSQARCRRSCAKWWTSSTKTRRSTLWWASTGGNRAGGGFMFVNLKPVGERKEKGSAVIARLRPQLQRVTGVRPSS